jgi:uncharacterized membrane protein
MASFAAVCMIIVIAGIIIVIMKEISYSMVPYLLSDNPYIGYGRALKLSIAMTHGHKWNIFALWLSFIGWYLLSMLTFFVGMIFLTPYVMATQAELYVRLRELAIQNSLTTPQELNLVAVYPRPPYNGAGGGSDTEDHRPPEN